MNTIDNYLHYQKDTLLFQLNEDNINLKKRLSVIETENKLLNFKITELFTYVESLARKNEELQVEHFIFRTKINELEQLIKTNGKNT